MIDNIDETSETSIAGNLSRRHFLQRVGGGLLGAGIFAGASGCGTTPSRAGTAQGLLESWDGSTVSGQAQRFLSRPDLWPPQVLMHVQPRDVAPGLVLTDCHGGPAQQGPIILDSHGQVVWFQPVSAHASKSARAFNLRVQQYRDQPVISFFEGEVVSGHGQGHYEILDSTYKQVALVEGGNGYDGDLHEFLISPEGTALFTCYGAASGDLSSVGGASRAAYFYGVVQEVDIATGKVIFQWRSDEHVAFEESYRLPLPTNPASPWDYFHINSINIDPADGNLVVSGRNTWTFYKVDRHTGAVLWRVGGKQSDFAMGPDTQFAFQHDVTPHPGGTVTLFDNEAGPPQEATQSRALVLALDEKARRATYADQYLHSPPVLSGALGSVEDLGDGHRFVGWGSSSYFTEYTHSGEVLLDGRFVLGTQSYRAFKQPWTGRPTTRPSVAVGKTGGRTALHVSWNGATEIDSWRVLGGPRATRLSSLGRALHRGFETAIAIPGHPEYVAAEGLDGSGRPLGRSEAIPARPAS